MDAEETADREETRSPHREEQVVCEHTSCQGVSTHYRLATNSFESLSSVYISKAAGEAFIFYKTTQISSVRGPDLKTCSLCCRKTLKDLYC